MALALLGVLLFGPYRIPELTTLANAQLDPHSVPIVPTLFITIACGAISGFHATQSPLMARCVRNERECRSGLLRRDDLRKHHRPHLGRRRHGLFRRGACAEALAANGNSAAWAVNIISNTTLGIAGGILALLGVVAAPDHIGRHGLPFGTADRRRHLPHRTAHAVEAFRHRPAALRRRLPHHAGRFHRRVALFRMDQPDARHDRAVGRRRMALRHEAQLFRRIAACRVHDLHLCVVRLRFGPVLRHGEPSGSLRSGRSRDRSRPLFHSVKTPPQWPKQSLNPTPRPDIPDRRTGRLRFLLHPPPVGRSAAARCGGRSLQPPFPRLPAPRRSDSPTTRR